MNVFEAVYESRLPDPQWPHPWFSTGVLRITVVCVAKILYYLYINILHIISFDIINMILFQHYDEIVKPRDKKNNYEDILTL